MWFQTRGPMADASRARLFLRHHFDEVSDAEFRQNVVRHCSDSLPGTGREPANLAREDQNQMGDLILFQPQPSPLPLEGYLASALTGLSGEQRMLVFQLSDVIATICAEHGITLYEPRKKTDPVFNAEVPDPEVFRIDRERVLSSDLLIHLCHYPSTGAGEELDFAHNSLVPIILISHSSTRVSRMIRGIPSLKLEITYTEPEDLRAELRNRLTELRPILEQRKLAFSRYDVNVVGSKVRALREELGLTREDVATSSKTMTVDLLKNIEESPDRIGNPSLVHLREIATILKTTVADLVEPDLSERLLVALQEWVTGRSAARFEGINLKDRNKIVRRVLLRVIDSLENE